jgi:hypothetical protein
MSKVVSLNEAVQTDYLKLLDEHHPDSNDNSSLVHTPRLLHLTIAFSCFLIHTPIHHHTVSLSRFPHTSLPNTAIPISLALASLPHSLTGSTIPTLRPAHDSREDSRLATTQV